MLKEKRETARIPACDSFEPEEEGLREVLSAVTVRLCRRGAGLPVEHAARGDGLPQRWVPDRDEHGRRELTRALKPP